LHWDTLPEAIDFVTFRDALTHEARS
jgi:hypothetical protein